MTLRRRFQVAPAVQTPAGGVLIPLVGTPTNGQVPVYDAANNRFVPGAGASGVGVSGSPASCRAYNNASISIADNTLTALTFNSERYDTDAYHSTSSNTSRLTIPTGKAGKYYLTGTVEFASNATGVRLLAIRLNGSTILASDTRAAVTGAATQLTVSTVYDLAVGDYVELVVLQTSGGALNASQVGNSSPEFACALVSAGVSVIPGTCGFRLTGVSGTPIMTADSTSLSTIYAAPYRGPVVALYNGATWEYITSAEVSLAVTGRTTDLPFDIFAYSNAGVLTLEFVDWTNATTRATGLSIQDGVEVKSGDATRLYMGTCRPRSATTFHWVRAADDTPAKFDLWNRYNQVDFPFLLRDTATSHTYTTATWRQWNASANYQVEVVVGLQESRIHIDAAALTTNGSAGVDRYIGIGIDSTTVASGVRTGTFSGINQGSGLHSHLAHLPGIGRHFYALMQISSATNTTTWYGDNNDTRLQSGMTGVWRC